MTKEEIARRIAEILDDLTPELEADLIDPAGERCYEALDQLYQDLARDDSAIPNRYWLVYGDATSTWKTP